MRNSSFYIFANWTRVFLVLSFFAISQCMIAQEVEKVKEIEGANAVREEIQRYMGYEPLMPRYLTLPYDATTNGNVSGPFVDIGYLFFALIPILFLLGFRKRPWYGIISMVLMLALLYISIGSGKIFVANQFVSTSEFVNQYSGNALQTFPSNIINPIYEGVSNSYKGVHLFFKKSSGDADVFTYPTIFALFVLMLFLIRQRTLDHDNKKRILILFVSFFTFMWMLLTAGIIWYGYPMIAMSILLMLSSIAPKKLKDSDRTSATMRVIGLGSIFIFVIASLVFRLSNYSFNTSNLMAKQMFDIGELKYQSGRQNKRQVLEGFFRGGMNEAFGKINQEDESLIYRVGTVLPFFVKKNDRRVFMDNQLQNFERLRTHFKDKNTLIEVLKAGGYKYIFVDLKTYSIDRTPEKTLENKYKEFMRVLYQNPKVQLLATDRQINISKDPSKSKPGFGVFGAPLPNAHGNYAIFELL